MNILALLSAAIVGVPSAGPGPIQAAPLRVVATLPVYAEIAKEIGGAEVEVSSIANPNEDAHFVRPKPSFALDLRRADVFINTGLDLELWVPTLLDRAANSQVMELAMRLWKQRFWFWKHSNWMLSTFQVILDGSSGRTKVTHCLNEPRRC